MATRRPLVLNSAGHIAELPTADRLPAIVLGGTATAAAVVVAGQVAQTPAWSAGMACYDVLLAQPRSVLQLPTVDTPAAVIEVWLRQDAAGGRRASLPANASWESDAPPIHGRRPLCRDVLRFATLDGGVSWVGVLLARDVPPAGQQLNLVRSQDLAGADWGREQVTVAAGTSNVMETVDVNRHLVIPSEPAMAKLPRPVRFTVQVDATPINGRGWLHVQLVDPNFDGGADIYFNVAAGVIGVGGVNGPWQAEADVVPFLTSLGNGTMRVGFHVTTGFEAGLRLLLELATDQYVNSYAGDPTKGMKLANVIVRVNGT